MLRDPLGEVARKERRSLLGISAVAILVGRTGLVPEKIENFGITFTRPERKALLWVFLAVVLYYAVAFIVYSLSDFLSYLYAVHQGRAAIKNQETDAVKLMGESPWRIVRFVTPASTMRGVFDFVIPLVVAVVAMWSLWGAATQVTEKVPSTPLRLRQRRVSRRLHRVDEPKKGKALPTCYPGCYHRLSRRGQNT